MLSKRIPNLMNLKKSKACIYEPWIKGSDITSGFVQNHSENEFTLVNFVLQSTNNLKATKILES